MSKLESEDIFVREWKELKVWKRFIDDILIIWDSSMKSLMDFFSFYNRYGIEFSKIVDTQSIIFWGDPNIFV